MHSFIELDDAMITNQPLRDVKIGRSYQRVPDPDVLPTEAYLFVTYCTRLKRTVRRKRGLVVLTAKDNEELQDKLRAFATRSDVVLLDNANGH